MTPLAQRIANELTLPVKARTFDDRAGLLQQITAVHCFEATNVLSTAIAMLGGDAGKAAVIAETLCFLPAPKTWIEWAVNGNRAGFLLEDKGDFAEIAIASWWRNGEFRSDDGPTFRLPLVVNGCRDPWAVIDAPDHEDCIVLAKAATMLAMALAFINTPRIIGRRQHMPHAGLQRKLSRAKGMVGKFPLHAWTEIMLEVTPPKVGDGEPHEARLTGGKALHFCRSHLRIRRGQLERVKAHWRGDPALGIKQSRYKLAA